VGFGRFHDQGGLGLCHPAEDNAAVGGGWGGGGKNTDGELVFWLTRPDAPFLDRLLNVLRLTAAVVGWKKTSYDRHLELATEVFLGGRGGCGGVLIGVCSVLLRIGLQCKNCRRGMGSTLWFGGSFSLHSPCPSEGVLGWWMGLLFEDLVCFMIRVVGFCAILLRTCHGGGGGMCNPLMSV
jgi:hypothetical protein